MSLSRVLYCRYADNLTASASLSLLSGSAAAAFPLNNAKDGLARTVFKSTGTGCVIRSHWAAPVTPKGLALHFHKLAGATVTVSNPAGFSMVLTIPANTEDGHCIDPWDDYRGMSLVTDDDWDITIAGAATVCAIGEIVWMGEIREILMDRGPVGTDDQAAIVQASDYHPVARVYSHGTRVRSFSGHITPSESAIDLLGAHRGARGPLRPFTVIPDSTVNDALFAHLLTTQHRYVESGPRGSDPVDVMRETDVQFIEALRGLAL